MMFIKKITEIFFEKKLRLVLKIILINVNSIVWN